MTRRFEKTLAAVKSANPGLSDAEARLDAQELCDAEEQQREDDAYDAACFEAMDPAAHGRRDDSPSLQSADQFGTGEGQFHGVI